jgi:Do/DeqQ family serine protease
MLRFIFAFLLVLPLTVQAQMQRAIPESRPALTQSFAPVVKRVTPAVVNVYASRVERQARNPLLDDPLFRQFFGGGQQSPRTSQSLGSGVIVDPSGLVVTNHHVIENMTNVRVALSDRREFDAEIVLRDPRTDLAVLRIKNGGQFPALELGDSDAIEVGDVVLAIGNPFGVGQTVTMGIVSALARTQVGITDYGFFIQTDAAINPGNSGGALVDSTGRLAGINSAIYSRSGGSIGIGFAIPVNMVKVVVAAAKGGVAQVRRPWPGATLQNVSREIAESIGLDRPAGALVTDLVEGGPAAQAGLRRGDVITAIDGLEIDDPEALSYRIGTRPVGSTASLSVLRNGKKTNLTMRLVAAPEMPPREAVTIAGRSPFTGATVINLSPAVTEEFSIESFRDGVVISEVPPNSVAARVGLQRGDVILAVNDAKIARTSDLRRVTENPRNWWRLTIGRGGQIFTTAIGG